MRSHPLAVSRTARLARKAIAAIWRLGIDEKPPLDPDYLWRIGSRGFAPEDESGERSAEDVADFRDRLDRLCRSLREEAALNPLGHTLAYGQLTAAIRKRHALGRLWRTRPELARTEIAPPIVVVGQMRSGTTRLHRLLAADPAHAGTRFCDSFDPVPRSPDLRPLKGTAALMVARRINPWLDTLHPFGATRADEEIGWLSAALNPCAFEAQWRIPGYVAWSEAQGAVPVYREFARILRTDAATRGNTDRPRVLKCPQFTEDLPDLLAQLPGARVAASDRDESGVWASSVSLVSSQSAFQSDHADLAAIEAEWHRKIALRDERMAEALRAFEGPVAVTGFEALNADWRKAIAATYTALGLRLSPAALAGMERERSLDRDADHRNHAAMLRRFAET
ncbi:sulfotransferase [Tsuneonella amylolytica]|uniref:sulfotransferase n=1 Tax=Tsuneonella amylolytica TaxID=2338327 RepID=UPI000EA8C78A|nr:sulfotransferase [Tsuneonella amylolytica]